MGRCLKPASAVRDAFVVLFPFPNIAKKLEHAGISVSVTCLQNISLSLA